MELQNSHAAVTLDPKGQMTLRASISGFNPTKRTNNPITLNYTHQENMFELWNMIDYGSQFEQNLQYKLYKTIRQRQMIKHLKFQAHFFYFCGNIYTYSLHTNHSIGYTKGRHHH